MGNPHTLLCAMSHDTLHRSYCHGENIYTVYGVGRDIPREQRVLHRHRDDAPDKSGVPVDLKCVCVCMVITNDSIGQLWNTVSEIVRDLFFY